MKYLTYIALVMVGATAASLAINLFYSDARRPESVFMTVNNQVFSKKDVKEWIKDHPYAARDRKESINRMIDTALILQEAYRLRIDQKKEFQEYVQDFVNQSLVSIMLKRKEASLNTKINQKEIQDDMTHAGTMYKIALYYYSDESKGAEGMKPEKSRTIRERYENLPFIIREHINHTELREFSAPFLYNNRYVRLRIIDARHPEKTAKQNPEKTRKRLIDQQKQYFMEQWLKELRSKADIRIKGDLQGPASSE